MSLEFTLRGRYDDILLVADFEDEEVRTSCGDVFMDYSIPFGDFLKFADFIKDHWHPDGKDNGAHQD